jgi:hypothetical protein
VATVSHRLAPFIHNFRYKNPETVWFALTMEAAGFSETLHTTELRAITFKRAGVSRPLRKPRTSHFDTTNHNGHRALPSGTFKRYEEFAPRKCTYNVTLRGVRATVVAVGRQ